MASAFTKSSLKVCRDFLQTAVIIDDKAFYKQPTQVPEVAVKPGRGKQKVTEIPKIMPKKEGSLNTQILIKNFADLGIICSALEFTNYKNDSNAFISTAKVADIVIIDWEMEEEKNGENALKLISSLLKDDFSNPERFRLVTIYTGHEDLVKISQKVISHLKESHGKELISENAGLRLVYQSIVILIYAKDPHGLPEHFKSNAVDEAHLPERLVACFTENISGILPNTALSALTAIRHSTYNLLALFNRNLDYAYLTHRASLPNPTDADSQLEILIAEEIKSILSSYNCIGSNASFPEIKNWLLEKYKKNHQFSCTGGILDRDTILNCLDLGINKTQINIRGGKKKLYQKFSQLLSSDAAISSTCDLDLSKLTVFKTRYKNSAPFLTTGVILQQRKGKSLWVCIQPKCDSVRLEKKSRKFPLLPIFSQVGGGSTLPRLRDEDIENFCHIPIHPQHCRSIEFKSATKDKSKIYPYQSDGKWIYLTTETLRFEFITELKDEIAQSFLNDFAATTARVGINPSEWLRKSGNRE